MSVLAERISEFIPNAGKAARAATQQCPWCDQPIPAEKLKEIKGRIAAREHARLSELTSRLKDQFARERSAQMQVKQNELERLRKEANETAERLKREAQQQLQQLKVAQENQFTQRLREQRDALEKDRIAAIRTEHAKMFEERQKLQARVQELQKQLDGKAALQMGEGADINLYESLKSEFPNDQIKRVYRTSASVDILHTILHNGKECGRIIYDSNVRSSWRNEYVARLRQDQLAARADHALLVTLSFPAGLRQLHIQDNVIIVNPARVVMLAQILRKHILQMHVLRLSNDARGQKTTRLYEFITSERCAQLLEQIRKLSDDMLDLDVKEKKSHDLNWKRRGELIRYVQRIHGDFSMEIGRIIGTGTGQR